MIECDRHDRCKDHAVYILFAWNGVARQRLGHSYIVLIRWTQEGYATSVIQTSGLFGRLLVNRVDIE